MKDLTCAGFRTFNHWPKFTETFLLINFKNTNSPKIFDMRLLTFGKAVIQSGVELDPVIHNESYPQSNGVYF